MRKTILLAIMTLVVSSARSQFVETPRLAVVIVADHMNANHFDRYGTLFTGGFKWLADHGIVFTESYHNHAESATGPGHFVLGSGQYPAKVGVTGNNWYDRNKKKSVYCVEDEFSKELINGEEGRSFRNINTYSLGDWVKEKYPSSKVYSVAGKDRSSVMNGGRKPDLALWYNWKGQFTTSDYYAEKLPDWVIAFNDNINAKSYRDSVWTRYIEDPDLYEKYARRDNFPGEYDDYDKNEYSPVFPIGFDKELTDEEIATNIGGRPWLDKLTIEMSEEIILQDKLGQDNNPDIMLVNLSALDWVTHDYGPFSQEVLDMLLRIDTYLENFIEFLDNNVGLENVVFILTADHGGMALPEYIKEVEGKDAGRISSEQMNKATKTVNEIYGLTDLVIRSGKGIYFDKELMKRQGIKVEKLAEVVNNEFKKISGIERAIGYWEFSGPINRIPFYEQLRNSYLTENAADMILLPKENWVMKYPYGTSHGTPYDYDRHVTTLFAHVNATPQTRNDKILTVDIAPTIADLLKVAIPDYVDGKVIKLPGLID